MPSGGTLTEEKFTEAAEQFWNLSQRIGDGWELIETEGAVYLKKKLKQTMNKAKCSRIKAEEEPELELPVEDPSIAEEVRRMDDTEVGDVYQFEYHVVYSISYQVPVLYFNAYKSDGTMLRLEEAWCGFRELATESREQLRQTLTQMDHPILFRPFLALHPCRTEQVLANIAPGCDNLLVAFLSSYGPFINLNLDVRYGSLGCDCNTSHKK